jgi:transposase InsO family protein
VPNGSDLKEFTRRYQGLLQHYHIEGRKIQPGSPWENGYVESFNGKLTDELLSREIFYTLREAKVLIERWRVHYNTVRPHSSLGYRPPAPESIAMPLSNEQRANRMETTTLEVV